jgi:glucan phosphoethanolaminetransferase (alkaline phosphatase superfamily)
MNTRELELIARILIPALILVLIVYVIVCIPAWIGKYRRISRKNLFIVRLLAILGLVSFGLCWFVALLLACIYPEEQEALSTSLTRMNTIKNTSNPPQEVCQNCNRVIGKLEQPYVWREHIVCRECHTVLSK